MVALAKALSNPTSSEIGIGARKLSVFSVAAPSGHPRFWAQMKLMFSGCGLAELGSDHG